MIMLRVEEEKAKKGKIIGVVPEQIKCCEENHSGEMDDSIIVLNDENEIWIVNGRIVVRAMKFEGIGVDSIAITV